MIVLNVYDRFWDSKDTVTVTCCDSKHSVSCRLPPSDLESHRGVVCEQLRCYIYRGANLKPSTTRSRPWDFGGGQSTYHGSMWGMVGLSTPYQSLKHVCETGDISTIQMLL